MRETPEDLERLQRELDESYAHAGLHLRSIFTEERRMTASEVAGALRGVFVLQLATVTAAGAPLLAPIDGLFYRGRLWFGVPPGAVRIAHLRARPRVSAVYARGEDLCVIAHGTAREVSPKAPEHAAFTAFCRDVYGPDVWDFWQDRYRDRAGADYTAWIEPRRLFAMQQRDSASAI